MAFTVQHTLIPITMSSKCMSVGSRGLVTNERTNERVGLVSKWVAKLLNAQGFYVSFPDF